MAEPPDVVDLLGEEAHTAGPRRPAKRVKFEPRAEQQLKQQAPQHQVFLVDSSDDEADAATSRPAGAAPELGHGQAPLHRPRAHHWGALADPPAPGPRGEQRPVYRPPSARLRRQAELPPQLALQPLGGQRSRWADSRMLQEMLPFAMALPMGMAGPPFGFLAMGGGRLGPGEERPGSPPGGGAHRRAASRQALAAYREQHAAMREQLLAAHRAGIPASMLLSDRDFTPEDYELLCRLDDKVENRRGAKDEQVAALPSRVLGAAAGGGGGGGGGGARRRSDGGAAACVICLEELAEGAVVKELPCAAAGCRADFHAHCLDTWLRSKAACPVCLRELAG